MRMIFKKILAYTLAEVLITMSIVGAIAAMTIPTLVNKRVQAERSAKLKKFYSRMINAVDQMVTDNNSFKYMPITAVNTRDKFYNWYISNVDHYMGHAMIDKTDKIIYFVDESSLSLSSYKLNSNCVYVLYDTNGLKGPNRKNSDQYYFLFCFNDSARSSFLGDASIFFGTSQAINTTLKDLSTKEDSEFISYCLNTDFKYQAVCTRWLQNNGWDYPARYPIK